MDIGIGLPTTLTVDGPAVVEWARRAEERGFATLGATLGTVDRLVYPNYDTITALSATASPTSSASTKMSAVVRRTGALTWEASDGAHRGSEVTRG
jgi:hypothetical protein